MLTTHDKNGGLYLTGHSIKQATKNSHNWTTPGLHMSGTHGQESVGQLTTSSPTQESMTQLGSLVLKPPRHDSERLAEDQPPRRPLKLTPLELPEEVREAQRKKLNLISQDAKRAACKLDIRLNSNAMCKPKPIVRQKLVKAVMSPSVSTMPVKTAPRQKSPRPQLARSDPVEMQLQDVACRAIQASVCNKAAPLSLPAGIKAEAACDGEASRQNLTALRPVVERRRLRREKCLEEDQCQSNMSPGGLSTDGGRFTQGVRGKGQQTEWACRGQPHAGKNIKDLCAPVTSCKQGTARRSHQEEVRKQTMRHILNRQSDEGGNRETVPTSLIMKHNDAHPLEALEM